MFFPNNYLSAIISAIIVLSRGRIAVTSIVHMNKFRFVSCTCFSIPKNCLKSGNSGNRQPFIFVVAVIIIIIIGSSISMQLFHSSLLTDRLVPTAQYYPLRFLCIRELNRLSSKTSKFIPGLPFLMEVTSARVPECCTTCGVM